MSKDIPEYKFIEPNYYLSFLGHDHKELGRFDFNGDKLKFEGDVEESAKIFIDFLLDSFNTKIEYIKSTAWNDGYEKAYGDGWEKTLDEN